MVINDLSDYSICKIFCWVGFVGKNKFVVLDKTFYNDKDVVIVNIIDKIFRFKQFNDKVYNNRSLNLFRYR